MSVVTDGQSRAAAVPVMALQFVALVPPIGVMWSERGSAVVPVLAVALAAALLWEVAFARLRGYAITLDGLTTALIVVVMAPAGLPLWQLAVALSLGVILGELIFGGRGFGFLSAATVTLAILAFSFSGVAPAAMSQEIALATLPGAVLLAVFGLISWRVMAGMVGALAIYFFVQGGLDDPLGVAVALAFPAVFLVCDPVAAAATNPGRWAYGALAGVLAGVFGIGGIVFAALLASLFAPLIDHLAVLANAAARRRRHG
jgi:Na+-transporting NADH:ubiquinone oxidoreductase subunit B